MTAEEIQKTMEFLVVQQAKFEAEIQKLLESDKDLRQADERLRGPRAIVAFFISREITSSIILSHKGSSAIKPRRNICAKRSRGNRQTTPWLPAQALADFQANS